MCGNIGGLEKKQQFADEAPFSESRLRRAVRSYVEHSRLERNHQGLDNELIEKSNAMIVPNIAIKRKERIGGLLNYYYRESP